MLTINTNIDELIAKFKTIAEKGEELDASDALLAGAVAGLALMDHRIFNDGKDKNLVSFGKYTGRRSGSSKKNAARINKLRIAEALNIDDGLTEYEKKRLKEGRQIGYKDLEFTGDLRRGVVTGKQSNTQVICWIANDDLFKISKYQEEQIGKIRGGDPVEIFALNDDEKQAVIDNTKEGIKQIYDRVFNNI